MQSGKYKPEKYTSQNNNWKTTSPKIQNWKYQSENTRRESTNRKISFGNIPIGKYKADIQSRIGKYNPGKYNPGKYKSVITRQQIGNANRKIYNS